jgi:transposase-like protein
VALVLVKCSSCQSDRVYRHGKAKSGIQRYRCRDCCHCFQLDYVYEANKEGVTDKIVDMALNGSGIRDTSRVLGISTATVMAYLKNLRRQPFPLSSSTKSQKKQG